MNDQKNTLSQKFLLATSLLSLSLVFSSQLPTMAQEAPQKIASTINITFDPPKENQPQATKGGASRGDRCALDAQAVSQPFTPLLPDTNYGLTTASHPTLLVHIPATSAQSVFLTLQNDKGEEVYQTILPISTQSGVVSLDLPQEAPALETDKNYQWSIALMCDQKLRPDSPVVQGYVKRVAAESTLAKQLASATPIEMAALYGQAGIWYETVATLAELRQAEPENQELVTAWNNLLNSVGLEKVVNAQLMN
jgi:hypothetical protein